MKGRRAFLFFSAVVALLITGELYVSMRENAADDEVRRLNKIPEGEEWAISGTFSDPPSLRFAEQGPLATPREFIIGDSSLGYRLRPNLRALPMRRRQNGHSDFEVTLSTGRFGWRSTPQVPNASADVLFLGETFGSAVNDAETLPARFSAAFDGKALAHNLGVPGWGPKQYLQLLEQNGAKDELELGRVTKVFFLLAPVVALELREGACDMSSLCSWLRGRAGPQTAFSPAQEAPTLQHLAEEVRKRYGAGLTVVLWNPRGSSADEAPLKAAGLDVVTLPTAVPGALGLDVHTLDALGTYLAQRLGR